MSVDSSNKPTHEPGAADHDEPYTWGLAPTMYIAPRQLARMMVLRSRLDNRNALRERVISLPDTARGVTERDASQDEVSRQN